MANTINRFATLSKSAQVCLLHPSGISEKCSSYLKLSTGKKLLVTMPEANPSECFSSNFMLPKINELAKKLTQHGIETFVVIPNEVGEMRAWLHQFKVTQFSIFCDPENVISDALGITIAYQGGPAKYPNSPEKLHLLLENGSIVYQQDTDKDYNFKNLLNKVDESYLEKYNRIA